ncbi:MAG: thiamine phosphate synthase [Isosphaeraceae bacterium]
MSDTYTAGAWRALRRALARAIRRSATAVEPADLLAALVDEEESRATSILIELGFAPERVFQALETSALELTEDEIEALAHEAGAAVPGHSPALRNALNDAAIEAKSLDRARHVGTEHLLAGLLSAGGPIAALLEAAGLEPTTVAGRIADPSVDDHSPLPLPSDFAPLDLGGVTESVDLGRILDASANRAREGLRVVEDYARFVLDDPGLTRRLKDVRHRLAETIQGFDPALFIAARDTRGDVGTHIMTTSEQSRENTRAVLIANFKRVGEALRTLEEYGKLVDVWIAGRFEVLRYDVYTLEKLVLTATTAAQRFGSTRLMVLVGGLPTLGDLTWIVGEALAGGADAIQLREKHLPDREWLTRAREVRILTAQSQARFVVNDRPDLARLAGADAVHLGQDDLTVRDARRVVGAAMGIGVSTHDRAQLDEGVLAGASYLGVGPVFESRTKSFDDEQLAGIGFVRLAAERTNLPWFAIGGIDETTIDDVIEAGARRIAVGAAVTRADRPRAAAAALRQRLDAAWETDAP